MVHRVSHLAKAAWFTSVVFLLCMNFKANAGQVANFQLTPLPGNNGLTIFQADVQPAFSVVPSDPSASPLKVLDGSTGFNQKNMTVLLGNGDGVQQLVMLFGVEPSRDSAGNLNLIPTPTSASTFSLTSLTLPASSPSSPANTTPTPVTPPAVPVAQVPEPVSIALWVTGMGLGTLRALRYRRNRLNLV